MSEIGPGSPHRLVELPGSRVLEIREVLGEDAPALLDLYGSLASEDVYLRFFSSHPPPRHFIERMAAVGDRGGCGLLAVVRRPESDPRVVGEASYELLSNGDGELGITVVPEYRGWLGPYLLDTLVGAAAARGVPNLEAEVLVANRRMLTLLRRRGLAVLDHDDAPATMHVAISTTGRVPTWAGEHDRPRILVEARGGRWHAEGAARRAGFQLAVCQGPMASGRPCPETRGGDCPLASGSDVIVDALAGPEGAALLEAHHKIHPTVALCVEAPADLDAPQPGIEVLSRDGGDTAVIEILQRLAVSSGPDRPVPPDGPGQPEKAVR